MDAWWESLRLLLLLGVANIAPIAAKRLLGERGQAPIDAGLRFFDGRPLLGPSKTWRGLAAALVLTTPAALLLGLPAAVGALLGAGAMAGDALSSFIKRRLGIASSGRATGLDQIPEALLPLLLVAGMLDLSWLQIVAVVAIFFVAQIPLAHWSHRLGLRDRPY